MIYQDHIPLGSGVFLGKNPNNLEATAVKEKKEFNETASTQESPISQLFYVATNYHVIRQGHALTLGFYSVRLPVRITTAFCDIIKDLCLLEFKVNSLIIENNPSLSFLKQANINYFLFREGSSSESFLNYNVFSLGFANSSKGIQVGHNKKQTYYFCSGKILELISDNNFFNSPFPIINSDAKYVVTMSGGGLFDLNGSFLGLIATHSINSALKNTSVSSGTESNFLKYFYLPTNWILEMINNLEKYKMDLNDTRYNSTSNSLAPFWENQNSLPKSL